MGKVYQEPIKWTTPYAGTPLEPSVLLVWSNNPEGLGNPQETAQYYWSGILRDYTGRD